MITVFLPTLLGLSMLVFGAMHLIPGSFVDVLLGVGRIFPKNRDSVW
jgi:ABC-type dipeptide/oligopeptide/nickel transport system permease component